MQAPTWQRSTPRNAIYVQFQDIFRAEGVELIVERKVFEQLAELAIEYKTGARSLRGLFEELISPILYRIPDERDIERVTLTSLFAEPAIQRRGAP